MADQVSDPCEIAGTVTVPYILIIIILDSKWENNSGITQNWEH
jgi:hypothetical protein